MLPRCLWALLPLFSPVHGVFQKLYCSLSDSCDCDFKPDMRGLEWDLYRNVFGQHLAQDTVSQEVSAFLQMKSPERPLVLSLHGASGTGKTLVSSMLVSHLYGSGLDSAFVHHFVPTLHFPQAQRLLEYQRALKDWVQGNLTSCARSVFLFDEMENMPPGLMDVLEPFLGPFHVVYSTNYRKAIYVFISTVGAQAISKVALNARVKGRDREEIKLKELQDVIAQEAFSANNTGWSRSSLLAQKLVTVFVPFLPLTRVHVERCVGAQLALRGLGTRSDVVQAVGGALTYSPKHAHYFSTTGCKAVTAKINLFL
ncbi:prosalusin [Eucyclogobius newberryi]|uniref:prosalusin n=1 Tax=Eucyclogobius newberryi TaxID=166745 RepID=UPI003B59058F